MTVLTYFLYLVITLLVFLPFGVIMMSSIIASYFMYKEKYTSKIIITAGKTIAEIPNQRAMQKEKENA